MPPKTRKGAKTQFDIDPCAGCSKSTTNGLECDKCSQWYCPNCINSLFPNTITTQLYDMLCTMETFPWICHNWSAIPLGAQLMAAKVADRQSLLQLGVDPKSLGQTFAEGKQDFSPPTSVYSQRSLQPPAIPTTDSVGPSTSTTSTDALLQQLLTQQTQQQLQMQQQQQQMAQQQQQMQQQIAQQMAQQQQMLQAMLHNMNIGSVSTPMQHGAAVSAGLMPQYSTPVVTGVVTGGGVQMSDIPAPTVVSGSQPAYSPPTPIPVSRFYTTVSGTTTTTRPIVASGYSQPSLGIHPISTPLGQSGYSPFSYTPAGGFGQASVAAAGPNLAPAPIQMPFNVPLPTIKLTEFFGDLETFDAWWESFDANVNSRAIPEKLKWDYLQQTVKGNAAKKIEGLGFSASNYSQALQVLQSVYGRSELLRPNVWASLNALAPVKPNLKNLEEFTDAIRSKTITLRRLGVTQDALDEYTTSSLLCKLPSNLQNEIYKMRLLRDAIQPGYSKGRWTLENFLETLVQFQFLAPTPTGGNGKERHRDTCDESQAHGQSYGIPTMANLIQSGQQRSNKSQNRGKNPQAAKGSFTFPTCMYCNENHYSDKCRSVTTYEARRAILKSRRACIRCLSTDHSTKECQRNKPCFHCNKPNHHRSLCWEVLKDGKPPGAKSKVQQKLLNAEATQDDPPPATSTQPPPASTQTAGGSGNQNVTKHLQCIQPTECAETDREVIMPTIPGVLINTLTGEQVRVLACLDTGCTNTNLRQEVATQLNLQAIGSYNATTARYGDAQLHEISGQKVEFIFKGATQYAMKMQAATVPNLCPKFPIMPVNVTAEIEKLLDSYNVVNKPPTVATMQQIDLLIGGEYYNTIMHAPSSSVICLPGSLRIHLTPFGGVLSGCSSAKTSISKKMHRTVTRAFMCMTKEDTKQLEAHDSLGIQPPTIQSTPTLWSLDCIGLNDPSVETSTKDFFDAFFRSTTVRLENGRYEVRLPFKSQNPQIDDNLSVAIRRLTSTVRKLSPDGSETEILRKYDDIFKDYLQSGKIEKVTKHEIDGLVVHYLSHFPVVRESRATTKVRIVLDPSLKTKNGVCLNDLLFTGSNLMEDLTGMLLRFRVPNFAITADIQAAFLAVSLAKPDRDAVRFLWLKDSTNTSLKNNIQIYRFRRVAFGLCCSPWLLNATVKLHLEQHESPMARKFDHQIYMDNAILMAQKPEDCVEIYKGSKQIFQEAEMNLREWHSNCPSFHSQIPKEDRATGTVIKVLGLLWNTVQDTIALHKPEIDQMVSTYPTKRHILHNVAKTWDPLGLCNPVIISGRLLIQRMWREQLSWDDPASDEIATLWQEISEELHQLGHLELPRQILQGNSEVQLLCFTDASPLAYAAVIYLKQEGKRPEIAFSKARVAPMKPQMTLPRLELLGILIGIRAMNFVEKHLNLKPTKCFMWSDSQIAIHQVQSQKLQPIWIQRRVDEIRKSSQITLLHIPGAENPADHATRGITMSKMVDSNWFHGPPWLAKDSCSWPKWPLQTSQIMESESSKVSVAFVATPHKIPATKEPPFSIRFEEFSSIHSLLKVTALCNRFINRLRKIPIPQPFVTAQELQLAERKWIKFVQEVEFSDCIQMLKNGKKNQLCKQLDLFLDRDGIIRCGGRLTNASLSESAIFPMLLPKRSFFTTLIIKDCHARNFHFKVKHTLSYMRTKYWIPSGITVVRQVLKGCLICQKTEGKAFKAPKMGQLPPERVSQSPAFSFVALDYLGPVSIKTPGKDSSYEKRWIAVFTCFAVRAVHLELVSDCTTDAAIRAIERFIARRGQPKVIMSDNQSTFIKAAKVLKDIGKNVPVAVAEAPLQSFFAKEGIQWKFIPQRSPWYNGVVERLVGMVKRALRKTLWRASVSEEYLNTLLINIEGVLNSRPLLSAASEFKDVETLTPAHFIAPRQQLGLPPFIQDMNDPDYDPDISKVHKDLVGAWKKSQKRLDSFWKIFQSHYLQDLREQHRSSFKGPKGEIPRQPLVGEVCLVNEPSPRLQWPLVRILALLPSKDGEVRYVEVQLPSGTVTKRAVKDLIPLEISPAPSASTALSPQVGENKEVLKSTPESSRRITRSMTSRKPNLHFLSASTILFLWFAFLPIALSSPALDPVFYPAQNDTYQVCLHGPGGLKLVIPPKQKCNYPPTCDKHKEVSVTLFTPTPFWPNTTAFFCYMEKVEICTYTGFFAGKGIVKPATISRTYVKKETCEQVVSSKQFNGTVLQPDKLFPQLFSTGKKLNVEYRWLETKCTKAENFIFETGEVSTKDGKHMVSNLQSTDHCHFSDGVCHSPEGTLIWSVKKFLHYCPYTRWGVYPATIDGDYISVSSLQSAFHLGKQRGASIHNCLPKTSYLTKEGVVLFLGVFTKSQNEQIQRSFSVEEQNTTLQTMIDSLKLTENLDPLNSKLNFLVLKLTSSWQEAFRKEFYQLCILAQKEWDIIRQLIYLDATRGVRALLGREDVSADFRGNALIVHKCHAMKVDQINLNHQVPNNVKCFLFLPAKVNSEYWFLIPGTRDLVPSSPEVPCHQVSHGHPSQHRQEMKIEQLLQLFDPSSLTNRSTLAIFSAPALFKAKILHSPQLIRGYAGKIMETERRLAAVINYTAELSFQPNIIRETLNGVGDLLGNVITSTGGALGGILKDGLEGAGELTNAVMSPFVTVGLTIATILLIIGVCGFGFYQRKLLGGPGLPRTLRQAIRRSVPAKYRRKALKSQDTQTDDQET